MFQNPCFDPVTGRLQAATSTTMALQPVQDLLFTFDELGNLTSKTDALRGLGESYFHDDLNRLTSVTGNSASSMSYDAFGNLTSKTGAGTYSYGSKPHAATNVGGVPYTYNANGSLTSGDGRTIGYTVFNKPDSLARSATTTTIDHDPNRERFRKIDNIAGSVTTTHYVGSIEKIWRPGGLVETKRWVDGEVVVTERSNGTSDERFPLQDHLGSIDVITGDCALDENQAAAFPEISETGATVVGQGKPGFPGGAVISPTEVDIIRP